DGAGKISYQPLPEGMPPAAPEQIRHYFENIAEIEDARFKLNRLYDYQLGKSARIRTRFQVWGRLKDGTGFYDSGLLAMQLGKDRDGSWEITSQEVINAQRSLKPLKPLFRDVTRESGL